MNSVNSKPRNLLLKIWQEKGKDWEHVKYSCSCFLGVLFLSVLEVKCCILDMVIKHLRASLCWRV